MKALIIPADGAVDIDGRLINGLDLSWITGVHAVVWNGTSGEVQQLDSAGRISKNTAITSLTKYQQALDQWEAARQALDAPPPPPGPPTPQELFKVAVDATQDRLDSFAAERGYDGILSLCTYATDPDPVFAAEGQRGVALRSATWAALKGIQHEVLTGQRPLPLEWDLVAAELPPATWE